MHLVRTVGDPQHARSAVHALERRVGGDAQRAVDLDRAIDHAAYVYRDGLDPVAGLDEAGQMDAMGLGWVVMTPRGHRPLILQKSGGLQGQFSYIAFAPTRGVGVFVSINEFNAAGFGEMAKAVNDLITELAPR